MSRPPSTKNDKIANAFISVGIESTIACFSAPEDLVAAIVGATAVSKILEKVRNNGVVSTTGGFYRRWETVDEFHKTLGQELVTLSFSPNPRVRLLTEAIRKHAKD